MRRVQGYEVARAVNTPEKLRPFYNTLEALYSDFPILKEEPWRIQNLDETGKSYDSHQTTGIFRKGQKNAHARTSGNREHASWMIHVNAAGEAFPPNVIFPGGKSARVDPDLLQHAPEGTVAWFSSNGWMEESHFHRYIVEVAYPRLQAREKSLQKSQWSSFSTATSRTWATRRSSSASIII